MKSSLKFLKRSLRFIDLFAGIGGFHEALKKLDMKCVFASEINQYARETYLANHKIEASNFNQDIRNIVAADIPNILIFCVRVFPVNLFLKQVIKKVLMMAISQKGAIYFFAS